MKFGKAWRARAKAALNAYFRRRSLPRTVLALVLLLTGMAGFFLSYVMLHAGLTEMWLRYPLAVIGSYAVLLGLIRVWVEVEKSRFDPDEMEVPGAAVRETETRYRSLGQTPSWLDYLNVPDFGDLDFDEGCLPVILLGALLILAMVLVSTIAAAPALIGEVFLDAFIVSVLYRRLRIAEKENWLGTAIRKTWISALVTALVLAIGGWALAEMAPGARSLGQAIEQIRSGRR